MLVDEPEPFFNTQNSLCNSPTKQRYNDFIPILIIWAHARTSGPRHTFLPSSVCVEDYHEPGMVN